MVSGDGTVDSQWVMWELEVSDIPSWGKLRMHVRRRSQEVGEVLVNSTNICNTRYLIDKNNLNLQYLL
jgi:hypothetical protein